MMERKPSRTDAFGALDPTKMVTYHSGREEYHVDGVLVTDFTECDKKLKELEAQWEAEQYQRDRLQEYPSIEECIHAILDDDLEALQAKRSAVKAKYPKPK